MAVVALGVLVIAHPTRETLYVGLALAIMGELWRLYALGYSGEHTRSSSVGAPELITAGPFAHCRNPLYLGNAANSLGVAIAAGGCWPWQTQLSLVVLCLSALLVVYGACIAAEEEFLAKKFGVAYEEYCARTPRLWPALRAHKLNGNGRFAWCNLSFEKMTLLWWALTWGYLYIRSLS